MNFKKIIITFVIAVIIGLVVVYSLQRIHVVIVSIAGFGVGYISYIGILLLIGIGVLIRFGARLNKSENMVHIVMFSGMVGISIGMIIAAMIGVSLLLI